MQGQKKKEVIYLLGGPGSGKGTQSKLLLDQYPTQFVHISTGSLLRQSLEQKHQENQQIIEIMKSGKLVPSKYLVGLVKQFIRAGSQDVKYILDGFPRNMENILAWNQVIGDEFEVKFLIYYECTIDELRSRLLNRSKTSGRLDDTPQIIEKRIQLFLNDTKPILEDFSTHGKIIHIDAHLSVEEVKKQTIKILKENKIIHD